MNKHQLLEKARSLPMKPGCYLMKKGDEVLYVGKAKGLKSRVLSYFNNSAKTPKTEILVGHVRDFDFLLTESETEALVLENNLIKKYNPKYNIRLRDDKSYPYVMVDFSETFPRLHYVRRIKRTSSREIFGPFVVGSNISQVLKILTKSFQLRDCSMHEFRARKEPCLLYQMQQCTAPCVGLIEQNEYAKDLQRALTFFRGEGGTELGHLENLMQQHAEKEEFERAAIMRDAIDVLNIFLEFCQQKNSEMFSGEKNVDIISFYQGEVEVDMTLYLMRAGMLLGHKNFHFSIIDCSSSVEEEVLDFLYQYYSATHDSLPDTIIAPFTKERNNFFSEALLLGINKKIKVVSRLKNFASLVKLTQDNASEHQRVRLSKTESLYLGLQKLKELLNLLERPILLECFDVAIFQGSSPTASQVVFKNGLPEKSSYRHYHLLELPEGNNDFQMMRELITRRMKSPPFPDVFIVDGGKGQVSSFKGVLDDLNCKIPVVGIAKAKTLSNFKSSDVKKTEERLIIPGRTNPYILNKNRPLLKIMTNMRDESHRFSRRLHHNSEKKKLIKSWVDEIKGIGTKIRQTILQNQKLSLDELHLLNEQELSQHFKIPLSVAKKIKSHLLSANLRCE